MILKNSDNKDTQIAELKRLITLAAHDQRGQIEQELRNLQSGIQGEQQASYLINFDYATSKNFAIIHDLRLEMNGRSAQIDHLLIHRTLNVFVLETKNFHSGLKITEDGEFLRWNNFKKRYDGMASPLTQNERHVTVLKDAFSHIDMPKRLGLRLSPAFQPYVLVAPKARIIRPKKFKTDRVIKADALKKTIISKFDKEGLLETLGGMSRFVSIETVESIGKQLIVLHQPLNFDYTSKFRMPLKEATKISNLLCRKCDSHDLSIQYGRYGYYFKCVTCDGNTPIKIHCGKPDHHERIRKQGSKFYRECEDCGTSSLFYVNTD